jgi:hypothetical protein
MERRYDSLFVKTFHYLVGSTSSDTILHLTGLQDTPIDEFGYAQHSFKKYFKFPNNLVLKNEHKAEGSFFDNNKLELEHQRKKRHYDEWKSMSWDRKIDRDRKDKQRRIEAGISEESAWETVCPRFETLSSGDWAMSRESYAMNWAIIIVSWVTGPCPVKVLQ